jgi:hypothetical protein
MDDEAGRALTRVGVTPGREVWKGNPRFRGALVPIGLVGEDPKNARRHGDAQVEAIAGSLAEFGQQRPLIVDAAGTVRVGNGTFRAAKQLGWTHVAAIRSDLKGADLDAYALADNRLAELSAWDEAMLLDQLHELQAEGAPVHATGFDDGWIDELSDRIAQARLESTPADGGRCPVPGTGGGSPRTEDDGGSQSHPDEAGQTECPECGAIFTPTRHQPKGS